MKKVAGFMVFILLAGMLAGCSGNTDNDSAATLGEAPGTESSETEDSASGTDTTPGERPDTITIASQLEFAILDPFNTGSSADANVNWCVYDSLLNMDVWGNYYPLVAKSWDISDDGLVYTFHLRDDVTFHNGEHMTAHDVVYSAERMKPSPFKARTTALYDYAEYVDDYTVNFILYEKSATFLFELAQNFVVYNEQAVDAAGDNFKENPVGCGPYKFVSMKAGEGVVLEAFEDYYDGVAPIKNIIYKVIPDGSTALVALENGEVDICDYVPAASYSLVEGNSNLYLLKTPFTRIMNLILNVTEEPFTDVKVRQAFGHAIDKDFLIDVSLEGYGTKANSLLNDRFIAYPPNVEQYAREYDPDRARELLAEAGYPNGEGIPVITLNTIEMFKKQCEIIQAALKEIGIDSSIEINELSAYLDKQAKGELHAAVMSVTLGGDASVFAALLTQGGAFNGACYYNEDIERLFVEAGAEMDEQKRIELYEEIYRIELEEMPYVPLYFPDTVTCGRADLDFETIKDYLCYKGNFYQWK